MVIAGFTSAFLLLVALTAALAWQYQRREARWRDAVKRLNDIKYALDQAAIVATTDVRGQITDVNDKFCEISGYTRDELIGQDHRIVNSGLHSKPFIQDLWKTIASGRVWHGELRNRAKDGHFYWVDTTIVPFIDSAGKPYQYTAIRSDITQRKAAEARVREQAALARLGQMAAVVAHEVKNPLAGIKGVLQVLMSRRPAGDPDVPVMADVVSRVDTLNDLIHDLLVYARPRPLRVEAIDLDSLLRQSIETLARDPMAAGIQITLDAGPLALRGDAELLKGAFLNVLLNAAQSMGGSGRLRVTATSADRAIAIEFADSGPGIPEDVRERIFEPFFTTRSRGTGLGLPIARRTTELHGGSLDLSCPRGGGTVVRITLPLDPPPPPV
ncbi:MAG: ATP-binding protein [Vicinamibacterales bacterium]